MTMNTPGNGAARTITPFQTKCAIFVVFFSFLSYILMMTVEQIVDIPASRRITIQVPPQIPVGKMRLVMRFPYLKNTKPAVLPHEEKKAT